MTATDAATRKSRIFISYRRDDTEHAVRGLAEDLRRHFAHEQVFQDIASIDPGADFEEALQQGLNMCAAVLVVIGPTWVTVADKNGRRRLDIPGDWVTHEVAESLRRSGVRVFPVLVGDADMPSAEELPESLQPLRRRQAFPLTVRHWASDVVQLVEHLKKVPGLDRPLDVNPPPARPRKPENSAQSSALIGIAEQDNPTVGIKSAPEPSPSPTPGATEHAQADQAGVQGQGAEPPRTERTSEGRTGADPTGRSPVAWKPLAAIGALIVIAVLMFFGYGERSGPQQPSVEAPQPLSNEQKDLKKRIEDAINRNIQP